VENLLDINVSFQKDQNAFSTRASHH